MDSNPSVKAGMEEKKRDYRFVLVVPGFGTEEDASRKAKEIRSILGVRLHVSGVQCEPFPFEGSEVEGEQVFVQGVGDKLLAAGFGTSE